MKALLEPAKTLAIILLSCTAALLALQAYGMTAGLSGVYQELFSPEGGEETGQVTAEAASRPCEIAVTNSFGHYGVARSSQECGALYDQLGRFLGEALGTAGEAREVSRDEYLTALGGSGVFFRYPAELELTMLAKWLGTDFSGSGIWADCFAVSVREDSCRLYAIGAAGAFCFESAVRAEALEEAAGAFMPNDAVFAFELSESEPVYSRLEPLTLLTSDGANAPSASASSPLLDEELRGEIIFSLGFNPYSESGYTDETGTRVLVENTVSVRISAEGRLTYRDSASASSAALKVEHSGAEPEPWECVEAARAAVEAAQGDFSGEAELYLSGWTQEGSVITARFDYILGGIKIRLTGGSAATVVMDGGVIRSMELNIRSYAAAGAELSVLPVTQAAAALPEDESARLELEYSDGGGEMLTAGWHKQA